MKKFILALVLCLIAPVIWSQTPKLEVSWQSPDTNITSFEVFSSTNLTVWSSYFTTNGTSLTYSPPNGERARYFYVKGRKPMDTYTNSVTLQWDVSPDFTVIGYYIYYGVSSRNYTNKVAVSGGTTTTGIIPNLRSGTRYYLSITSYNSFSMESVFDGEVSWIVPTTFAVVPVPAKIKKQ